MPLYADDDGGDGGVADAIWDVVEAFRGARARVSRRAKWLGDFVKREGFMTWKPHHNFSAAAWPWP